MLILGMNISGMIVRIDLSLDHSMYLDYILRDTEGVIELAQKIKRRRYGQIIVI